MTTIANPHTTITIRLVKPFPRGAGVFTVRWRDGRRRRSCLVAVDGWPTADEAIVAAVQGCYPHSANIRVVVPLSAWR